MKSALEMMKEVQEVETRKQRERSQYQQDLKDARKGKVNLSWWEKNITLRSLKSYLAKNARPFEHNGQYYVYIDMPQWGWHWSNYAAFLLEENGYLNVQVKEDICHRPQISANLPKTAAEQVLYGKSNR